MNIHPTYKHIDSTAGEFPSQVSYLYSSYEDECELKDHEPMEKVVILGSGANRIGQGIEFDYCCVQASKALREAGYCALMINSNPETVSTDYDISDKLFFEPLQLESVLSILDKQSHLGVITQFGGQTAIALTQGLSQSNVTILGTPLEMIDMVEDRIKFKQITDSMGITTPRSEVACSKEEAIQKVNKLRFPIIVRPSYIIGGTNISILSELNELRKFLDKTTTTFPILIEEFLDNATEFDIDAASDGENVLVCGILEHFEPTGIHSGDSHSIYPPFSLRSSHQEKLEELTRKIGTKFHLKGLFNIQVAIKEGKIYVIEVNPRASRTIPFLSKVRGIPFVKLAVQCLLGKPLPKFVNEQNKHSNRHYIKVPIFSNHNLGIKTFDLGPEMKSTGEIMTIGKSPQEAIDKIKLCHRCLVKVPTRGKWNTLLNQPAEIEVYKLQETSS